MSREPALCELLDDLRHDLAKYLGLPLRMLPRDAAPPAVRLALEQALRFTRHSGLARVGAREIYRALRAELVEAAAPSERLSALDQVLDTALAWEAALDDERPLDRQAIERDLDAVSAAIDGWLAEVRRG